MFCSRKRYVQKGGVGEPHTHVKVWSAGGGPSARGQHWEAPAAAGADRHLHVSWDTAWAWFLETLTVPCRGTDCHEADQGYAALGH